MTSEDPTDIDRPIPAAAARAAASSTATAPHAADALPGRRPRTDSGRGISLIFGVIVPHRRPVVLRDYDARPGPARPRLGQLLAGHPHRPRGLAIVLPVARPGAIVTVHVTDPDWTVRATAPPPTAPGSPTGAAASPPSTPRSAGWPPTTRPSRSPTGGRSARRSTASTRNRPSRPRSASTFRATHFEHDPALRFEVVGRTGSAARAGRVRARAAQQRRRHARLQPGRPHRAPVPVGRTDAVRVLDGGLRGRPLHPVPRRDERHRDVRGRPLPRRCGQERRPRRRPGDRHAHRRLQLRVPAVVRIRPKWACPLAPPENRLDLPIRAGERLAG